MLFLTRTCQPSCPSILTGSCHFFLFMHLKYIASLVTCLMSSKDLMLCNSFRLIFSEFSFAIKASFASCISSRLLLIIFLVGWQVRAHTLSYVVDGSLGFLPVANWYGEKPLHYLDSFWYYCTRILQDQNGIVCHFKPCLTFPT